MTPRRLSAVLLALTLGLTAPLTLGTAAQAAPTAPNVPALTHDYPQTTLQAWIGGGTSSTSLAVPDGTQPTTLRAHLAATAQTGDRVDVLAGDRVVFSGPATAGQDIAVPLDRTAVTRTGGTSSGQSVQVSLRLTDPTDTLGRCVLRDRQATLTGLSLDLTGTPALPTSVAGFFGDAVDRVSVQVPSPAGDGTAEAALQAVASLTSRYAGATPVRLDTSSPATDLTSQSRILQLAAGPNPVTTRIGERDGVPVLTMTGQGAELVRAVTALASDQIALASSGDTTRLSARTVADRSLTSTLAGLGSPTVRLTGYGQSSAYVGVRQAHFGGPVSTLDLHLRGTASAIPHGAQASLSLYWNDFLLTSVNLVSGQAIALDATVPATRMQRDNGLNIRLDALPDTGECRRGGLPVEVDLDGAASRVTAHRGQDAAPGFQRFPQVLGGHLPVALGGGQDEAASLTQAGHIVSALQKLSDAPLDVSVVTADALISGRSASASGLVVGASAEQAARLRAPLRIAGFRTVSATKPFGVSVDQPYATLQAFHSGSRDVLLTAGFTPARGDGATTAGLMGQLASSVDAQNGWSILSRDLLVAIPDNAPAELSSGTVVPQAQVTTERGRLPWWLWAGIAAAVAVIAVRVVFVQRRRSAVRRYVDAEEAARARMEPNREPPAAGTGDADDDTPRSEG